MASYLHAWPSPRHIDNICKVGSRVNISQRISTPTFIFAPLQALVEEMYRSEWQISTFKKHHIAMGHGGKPGMHVMRLCKQETSKAVYKCRLQKCWSMRIRSCINGDQMLEPLPWYLVTKGGIVPPDGRIMCDPKLKRHGFVCFQQLLK